MDLGDYTGIPENLEEAQRVIVRILDRRSRAADRVRALIALIGAVKDLPNPFWAGAFMVFAVMLAIVALLVPTQANVTMAVVAIASNIVSGSFGYISGHKDGAATATATAQATPPESTATTKPNP